MRRPSRSCAALALVVSLALPGQGRAAAPPSCAPPPGVTVATLGQGAPAPLVRAVQAHFGKLAQPGEAFNATDVVRPGASNRRLLFVWTRGQRWVVATEHGGRGYNNPVAAFNLSADGHGTALDGTAIALPGTLCRTAATLIGQAAH